MWTIVDLLSITNLYILSFFKFYLLRLYVHGCILYIVYNPYNILYVPILLVWMQHLPGVSVTPY